MPVFLHQPGFDRPEPCGCFVVVILVVVFLNPLKAGIIIVSDGPK